MEKEQENRVAEMGFIGKTNMLNTVINYEHFTGYF